MSNIIKVGKKNYEVVQLNLKDRCDLNDRILQNMDSVTFTMWVDVIKKCTTLNDEQINELSADDIVEIAGACLDNVNKKK
jgi:hypothetical protein